MAQTCRVAVPNLWASCHACAEHTPVEQWLPVNEAGEYVEVLFIDAFAIVPACGACYDAHARGGVAGLLEHLRHIVLLDGIRTIMEC